MLVRAAIHVGNDHCNSEHEKREFISQLEADARALWAVRVLDAKAEALGLNRVPEPYVEYLVTPATGASKRLGWWHEWMPDGAACVASPMAARLSAAEAVFPTLHDLRAELGERP